MWKIRFKFLFLSNNIMIRYFIMMLICIHDTNASASIRKASVFTAAIQADGMVYTFVPVTRHSLTSIIQIFTTSPDENLRALFRYDGIPTLKKYDAIFPIPASLQMLEISDLYPTKSVLYIGIWGGELLHSRKYFAGSPSYDIVNVRSFVTTCPSQFHYGDDCHFVNQLPLSINEDDTNNTQNFDISIDKSSWIRTVIIPDITESFTIKLEFRFNKFYEASCLNVNNSNKTNDILGLGVELYMVLYLDQEDEFDSALSATDTVHISCSNFSSDISGHQLNSHSKTFTLLKPIAGFWRLKVVASPALYEEVEKGASPTDRLLHEYENLTNKSDAGAAAATMFRPQGHDEFFRRWRVRVLDRHNEQSYSHDMDMNQHQHLEDGRELTMMAVLANRTSSSNMADDDDNDDDDGRNANSNSSTNSTILNGTNSTDSSSKPSLEPSAYPSYADPSGYPTLAPTLSEAGSPFVESTVGPSLFPSRSPFVVSSAPSSSSPSAATVTSTPPSPSPSSPETESGQRDTTSLSLSSALKLCPAGYTGHADPVIVTSTRTEKTVVEHAGKTYIQDDTSVTTDILRCVIPIKQMMSLRAPSSIADFALVGSIVPLQSSWNIHSLSPIDTSTAVQSSFSSAMSVVSNNLAQDNADNSSITYKTVFNWHNPAVNYAGELPLTAASIMLGGAMRVRLVVSGLTVDDARQVGKDDDYDYNTAPGDRPLQEIVFYVAVRCGALAAEPRLRNAQGSFSSATVLTPQNTMLLLTRDADSAEIIRTDSRHRKPYSSENEDEFQKEEELEMEEEIEEEVGWTPVGGIGSASGQGLGQDFDLAQKVEQTIEDHLGIFRSDTPSAAPTLSDPEALSGTRGKTQSTERQSKVGQSSASSASSVSVRYTWTIHKPSLPGLASSWSSASKSDSSQTLFVRVGVLQGGVGAMDVESDAGSGSAAGSGASRPAYELSLSVHAVACDESLCVHGKCVVQDGDVEVSGCECKYPWAGERCSELAQPLWRYVVEVAVLVGSNVAVVPGAAAAAWYGLPLQSMALVCAAASSVLYHLCDTEAWCLSGLLDFASLQILDVFFTLFVSIVTVLHFSALRSEGRASVAVLAAFLVLAPVARQPTSVLNLAFAIIFSLLICLMSWILRCGYNVCRSGARLFTRVSVEDSTESERSVSGHGRKDGGLEMSRSKSRVSLQKESDVEDRGLLDESVHAGAGESGPSSRSATGSETGPTSYRVRDRGRDSDEQCCCGSSQHALLLIFIGIILVIVGFCSFAFESRTNYWIVHSVWHFSAFGSTYFLIKGRHLLFDKFCFDVS